jgi:hypothetical protein
MDEHEDYWFYLGSKEYAEINDDEECLKIGPISNDDIVEIG